MLFRSPIGHPLPRGERHHSDVFIENPSIYPAVVSLKGQDWPGNIKAICEEIDKAIAGKYDIILFPKQTLTGPGCADYSRYTNNAEIQKHLQYIADYACAKKPELIISVGHLWRYAQKDIQAKHSGSRRSSFLYNRENLPF